MRTMYDGIASDAPVIPTTAQLVAGYVDGHYAWTDADWARFPHATHVRIATSATTDDGHVLDVETGNATPEEAVNWVLTRRHAGADPTVYCGQSAWPAIRAAFIHHDVPEPHYWVAHYDGDPAIPAGAIAKQYQSTAEWDLSSVADHWPGVDPATPTAPTAPAATEEPDVTTYYPIQVGPDPSGNPNAAGVATWPAGAAHVLQLLADPGVWGDTTGEFRLVFSLLTGPDVVTTHVAGPSESTAVQFSGVPGLNAAACRGVTITRPDGKKWPWGGGAE
jgi:hypothetical protein